MIGAIPGLNVVIATFAAYAVEKKLSKHPEKFGRGAIEGVAAPETANNAASCSGWIPLLSLGLPTGSVTSLIFGALMIQGLAPGPLFIKNSPEIFWGVLGSMVIGNAMLLILNLPLIGLWIKVLQVPYFFLFPLIILFSIVGAYAAAGNIGDVVIMIIFGWRRLSHEKICLRARANGTGIGGRSAARDRDSPFADHVQGRRRQFSSRGRSRQFSWRGLLMLLSPLFMRRRLGHEIIEEWKNSDAEDSKTSGGIMKLKILIVALALFGASTALHGQAFPNKPIELVVASSPGGGVDLIFRLIAEELGKNLKTQVNVVNQPAGGGAIAAEKVAGARKDGYILLGSLLGQVATMTVANPKTPANLARDFQPIAILHGYAAVIMLGRADAEFKTVKDIVAHAQKKPGDLIVAVGPAGTSLTLEVELLKRAAKIDLTSLPFAGSAQAITNLLGGHVNFAMASDVAAQPHIKAGKLVGIAVDVESAVLPNVPTFAKQGYPASQFARQCRLVGAQRLAGATTKTSHGRDQENSQEPKLQENLKSRGYNIDLRTAAADVDKLVKEEIDKYSRFTPEDLGWKAQ